jgi:hypothetical protein
MCQCVFKIWVDLLDLKTPTLTQGYCGVYTPTLRVLWRKKSEHMGSGWYSDPKTMQNKFEPIHWLKDGVLQHVASFFLRVSSNKETHHDPPLFGSRENCTRTRDDCLLSNIYTDLHGVPECLVPWQTCFVDVPAQRMTHWHKPFQKKTSFTMIPSPSWNPTSSVFAKRHVHICPGRPTSSLRWKPTTAMEVGKWWKIMGKWWKMMGKWWKI